MEQVCLAIVEILVHMDPRGNPALKEAQEKEELQVIPATQEIEVFRVHLDHQDLMVNQELMEKTVQMVVLGMMVLRDPRDPSESPDQLGNRVHRALPGTRELWG